MGLEGYRFNLPRVSRYPLNIPESLFNFEELSEGAQHRAFARRQEWLTRNLAEASRMLSKFAITAADVNSLLRSIAEDQTLVHNSYYTDQETIARIADWIAEPNMKSQDDVTCV